MRTRLKAIAFDINAYRNPQTHRGRFGGVGPTHRREDSNFDNGWYRREGAFAVTKGIG